MRANLISLQRHAENYLTEPEYQQFIRYLNERNSPNITVRMHANMEISRMANQIRKQVQLKYTRKAKVKQKTQ